MELINVGDPMKNLYRAAMRGDEQTLQQLLQRDASILAYIPEGLQTPLHISALLGHVPFTVALLHHDRRLACRVDSCGRTALHLASAEGHIHIVRVLLQVTNDTCLNRDREGRIPLHYAAMSGRTEVVQELIMASPESLSFGDLVEGSTVFHLCVTYNHLNTLKTLVKLDYATVNVTPGHQPRLPIFTCSDWYGNTILHLAIMWKRFEVVRYLLSIPEIRGIANRKNNVWLTAHNILKKDPKDLNIREIGHILEKVEEEGLESDDEVPPQNVGGWIKFLMKWIWYYYVKNMYDWLMRDGDKWLEEMKGNLSVVSTFIATISFAGLINPPGGFIQQGLAPSIGNSTSSNQVPNNVTSSDDDPLSCITIFPNNKNNTFCPGQALASSSHLHSHFERYLFNFALSFFSSLSVTLLLVSGVFSMKNKAMIWILSILMCITLTSLAAAYVTAMNIIIPDHVLKVKLISNTKNAALNGIWRVLLWIIQFLMSSRFGFWLRKKSRRWRRQHGRCGIFLSRLSIPIAYLIVIAFPVLVALFVFPAFGI